ncbi:MAG: type II toxin-antitoxin system VapC family toxin [Kiritimatiellae bacterium]|nr:type II toxin-antitoxin system VapC family toxin [Kiritimatiellia bacterium]
MACLDTSFLLDLAGGGGRRRRIRAEAMLRELAQRGEPLFTTRFNVAELYVGVYRSDDRAEEERKVQALLSGLGVLEFGEAEARLFGRITAALQEIGRPAGDMDVLIAAVAFANGHSLVTQNPSHFEDIPGLIVEGYGPEDEIKTSE